MKYNPKVVIAYLKECGIPEPMMEFRFHPNRKWRFDFAWATNEAHKEGGVALEVQGGLFVQGRHTRGAALVKEHEKLNEAAALGWRVTYVQPKDLCTHNTVNLIKRCLNL